MAIAQTPRRRWTWLKILLLLIIILGAVGAYVGWDRGFREKDDPERDKLVNASPESRFKYGSIGAEHDAGIPYWIFYVLPRMFPEKLPGPGGYGSMGVPWEQAQELPVGFTKKTIGFARVGNNCAVCHTATVREKPDSIPT